MKGYIIAQRLILNFNLNTRQVAQRLSGAKVKHDSYFEPVTKEDEEVFLSENPAKGRALVDDVTEVIELPAFDAEMFVASVDPKTVELKENVVNQLREYVTIIASTYRENPFHNYEHACHVQMSIMKLLQRVTTPEQINYDGHMAVVASDAHDYTYGIASDALAQFAVVFCR